MEVAGPLGTPLGLAQRKRASPRGEAGTPFVPSKRLPDWASLELSPSVESCGCGLGPSPVRLGKLVHTRTQEKGAVTPQEIDPDLPVSVQESPVEAWVNSVLPLGIGALCHRGTEYKSPGSPGGCWHKSF